jgi:hypothetical protein
MRVEKLEKKKGGKKRRQRERQALAPQSLPERFFIAAT